MTAADKLQVYLTEALRKVESKQFKRVSDALIESLPAIVTHLAETIRSQNSSASERTTAMELYDRMLGKLLKDEAARRKESVIRTRVNARKVKAEPMTSEDFSRMLCNCSNETADVFLIRMQKAQERWKANGGLR
jgi:hypothetical protein